MRLINTSHLCPFNSLGVCYNVEFFPSFFPAVIFLLSGNFIATRAQKRTPVTVKIIENDSHILELPLDTRPREDLCYEFNYRVLELLSRILSRHDRD